MEGFSCGAGVVEETASFGQVGGDLAVAYDIFVHDHSVRFILLLSYLQICPTTSTPSNYSMGGCSGGDEASYGIDVAD